MAESKPARTTIFVSHANPEDNDFARWVALRLAAEGFPVFCDLTNLLGGETFWEDIEAAIRTRTAKFLYVLSRNSNHKEGPRKELRIAHNVQKEERLKDFIVPLRIDDLPFSEVNIELADRTIINFEEGWANGLNQLIAKLDKEGVARSRAFGPQAVAGWWSQFANAKEGVSDQTDSYLSNWFPITLEPDRLWLHRVTRYFENTREIREAFYPAIGQGRFIISFAGESEVARFARDLRVSESSSFTSAEFLSTMEHDPLGGAAQRRRLLSQLLRLAWERFATGRGLKSHWLARRRGFFFTHRLLGTDRVVFQDADGKLHSRGLVGFRTIKVQFRRECEAPLALWSRGAATHRAPTAFRSPLSRSLL